MYSTCIQNKWGQWDCEKVRKGKNGGKNDQALNGPL